MQVGKRRRCQYIPIGRLAGPAQYRMRTVLYRGTAVARLRGTAQYDTRSLIPRIPRNIINSNIYNINTIKQQIDDDAEDDCD